MLLVAYPGLNPTPPSPLPLFPRPHSSAPLPTPHSPHRCETWCSNSTKKDAKTIDLCNNPMTKEPKLDQVLCVQNIRLIMYLSNARSCLCSVSMEAYRQTAMQTQAGTQADMHT